MRILLVTLFYEPLNNIAVTRLKAFNKYLTEFGHEVDVLTRHYSEDDILSSNLNKGMLAGDDFEGDYYKKGNVIYTKYKTTNSKLNFSNKLPKGIKGLYNISQLDVFHYSFVEYGVKAYQQEFSNNPHDIIIASSPVPAALLLAKQINEQFGVKWIADFRDSYFTDEDNISIRFFKRQVLNDTLKRSSGILYTSKWMLEDDLKLLSKAISKLPKEIIYNGFSKAENSHEEDIINSVGLLMSNKKLIVFTGTLYIQRNLNFFLDSALSINDKEVVFVFVGIQKVFKDEIIEKYSNLNIHFFDNVSYATSLKLQKMANFLLMPIWRGKFTGFPGKVFEYIQSDTKIIVDKEPPLELKSFLIKYKNFNCCYDKGDVFDKYIDSNVVNYKLTTLEKELISRKYQVKKLNIFLEKLI